MPRERVNSALTPAKRVEATLALGEELWLSDPVAARPLLEQVLADADAAGRASDGGRAAYMLGELLRRTGDLDGAAHQLIDAVGLEDFEDLARDLEEGLAKVRAR